jgi:hypothetical protein
MLLTWAIEAVTAALGWVFHLLPTFSMPSWMAAGTAFPGSVATTVGNYLHVVAPFLPVDLMLTVLSNVLSLWPAIIGFLIFQWVWAHVPTIGGFGTGDG